MTYIYNMRIHTVTDESSDKCDCSISGSGSLAGVTKAIILCNLLTYFELNYNDPLDRAIIETAIIESLNRRNSG